MKSQARSRSSTDSAWSRPSIMSSKHIKLNPMPVTAPPVDVAHSPPSSKPVAQSCLLRVVGSIGTPRRCARRRIFALFFLAMPPLYVT